MRTRTVIETNIEELLNINWLWNDDESVCDDETIAAAAKAWKMTPEAVKAIKDAFEFFTENLVEQLSADLRDIWKAQ